MRGDELRLKYGIPKNRIVISMDEASRITGLCRSTIYNHIQKSLIPGFQVKKTWLIPTDEFLTLLESGGISISRKRKVDSFSYDLTPEEEIYCHVFKLGVNSDKVFDFMPTDAEETLEAAMNAFLTDRERNCLTMKFVEGKTLESIGEEYDISRERVRQIIGRAIRRLSYHKMELQAGVGAVLLARDNYLKRRDESLKELNDTVSRRLSEIDKIQIARENKEKNLGEIGIEELNLPARAYHSLYRNEKKTILDVVTMTYEEISGLRHMGKKSLAAVVWAVHSFGEKMLWEN